MTALIKTNFDQYSIGQVLNVKTRPTFSKKIGITKRVFHGGTEIPYDKVLLMKKRRV